MGNHRRISVGTKNAAIASHALPYCKKDNFFTIPDFLGLFCKIVLWYLKKDFRTGKPFFCFYLVITLVFLPGKFFCCNHAYHNNKYICCLLKFGKRRIRRCNTDDRILRILFCKGTGIPHQSVPPLPLYTLKQSPLRILPVPRRK